MNRFIATVLIGMPIYGCGQAELSTAAAINADGEQFMAEPVRLEGTHVARNSDVMAMPMGRMDFLELEDASGRVRVWYDIARHRCPPRLGARLTVEGKVVSGAEDRQHVFAAKSITIDDEPDLADNEIRLCQLSLNEQQIHAEYGPEGLLEYWRDEGKPGRVLVYD